MTFTVFLITIGKAITATAIPRITDRFIRSRASVGMAPLKYLQAPASNSSVASSTKTSPKNDIHFALVVMRGWPKSSCTDCETSCSQELSKSSCGGVLIINWKAAQLPERSIYTAAVGSIYGVASLAGSLPGDFITDSYLTWR